MPRNARLKSSSRIYHVMLRAVNRQQIFYDEEDYDYFRKVLIQVKEKSGTELFAYCLMGNHVHLLVRENGETLETVFRRIGASFVYWYNLKYERVGSLFQDRYRSEPVEEDVYFMTVLRYILNNPVKAGLCRTPEEYAFGSAREYLSGEDGITDTALARSMLGENELKTFLREPGEEACLEMSDVPGRRLTDAEELRQIQLEFGTQIPSPGKKRDRAMLNEALQRLLRTGISVRQLSRLTGISKKIIEESR